MPSSDEDDIALILGAGRGSRMGTPKALMQVAGRPWWTIQRDRLIGARIASVWVVSLEVCEHLGDSAHAPRDMVFGNPDAPMMSSIAAGLASVRSHPPSAVFILPIDTPAPHARVWASLRASGDSPAAPSFNGRTGHPIRLPWTFVESQILPHAADPSWIASARLDRLVSTSLRAVPVDDPDVIVNLNTPADVARWVASARP